MGSWSSAYDGVYRTTTVVALAGSTAGSCDPDTDTSIGTAAVAVAAAVAAVAAAAGTGFADGRATDFLDVEAGLSW